jgi:Spy/CpxP family protein refolding chaperone
MIIMWIRMGIRMIIFIQMVLMMMFFTTSLSAYTDMTREKTHRHMEIAVFLAENDFYDARLILKVKDKIGLTEEQKEKIEDKMLAHEAFVIRNSAEIKIKELRFASYLKSEPGEMDRGQVEKYIREISKEKTDLIVHCMNYLLDLKEILTPSQLQKMAEIRKKMETLRGKNREKE